MAQHRETTTETQPDLFFWERPGLDFPFYNDATLKLWQPILLIASSLAVLLSLPYLPEGRALKSFAMALGTLIPFLIVARGNIGTIVKKPQLGDLVLVPAMLILTIAYSIGMGLLLNSLGLQMQGNAIYSETRGPAFFAFLLVQLLGEEMIKLNIFLGVMIFAFRATDNRKTSVIIAIVVTLFIFGIAHFRAYNGAIAQILLIQGLGSMFDLFCYMRTKNILTSYAMHVLQDFLFLI